MWKQNIKTKKEKMKIYISGKISDLDRGKTIAKFQNAKKRLNVLGYYHISNPMEFCKYKDDKMWENYIVECVAELITCDAIFMLSDWAQSRGARIEYAIAKELEFTIKFE